MAAPVPDTEAAATFLAAVLGDCSGHYTLFALDDAGNRPVYWADTVTDLARTAWAVAPTHNVWFGVASRRERLGGNRRGGDADCAEVACLWADIDIAGPGHARGDLPTSLEQVAAWLKGLPLPPSIVVHTGGGVQPYWLLSEPQDAATFAPTVERWGRMLSQRAEAAGWHLDNVFDLARVLRVPGTWNRKLDEPRLVRIVGWHPERRFGVDDVEQWLPAEDERPRTMPTSVPYIGPARPGDHFTAAVPASKVLELFGWTLARRDRNGNEQWTRPGKDTRQGSSATVYAADGRCVVWTDATQLRQRGSFTSYQLYAFLGHGGDFSSAARVLAALGYGERSVPEDELAANLIADPADRPSEGATEAAETTSEPTLARWRIVWPEFWAGDHTAEDWLVEPLWARGRGHALYAPAKTGKSILAQWIVAQVVRGRPALRHPGGKPLRVVYVDYENTLADLRERLESFGVGPDDDLAELHYISLPAIDPLDTAEGAKAVIDYCQEAKPDLVIFDTLSRAVAGDENSADTLRAFYRWCGMHLKSMGIAYVRLDHAGKDQERGQRGTSAKNDDVDVVHRLTRIEGGLLAEATHRRMAWVPEKTVITEREVDGVVSWTVAMEAWPAGTKECAADLDRLGVAVEVSTREAAKVLSEAGCGAKNKIVVAAVKWRRQRAQGVETADLIASEERVARREAHMCSIRGSSVGSAEAEAQTPCSDDGKRGGKRAVAPDEAEGERFRTYRYGSAPSPAPEAASDDDDGRTLW